MAIVIDWIQDAAEEIAQGYDAVHEYLSAQWVAGVIRKHCPFKPDVAYREVTAADYPVDYMHNDDID